MNDKKIIVFSYYKGWNDTTTEEIEYDINASEEEINKDYEEWVWNLIGDNCNWYEKE